MLKPPKTPNKPKPQPKPVPELRPHPLLFWALCVVFGVWIVILLVMYFLTVYPLRHGGG